MRFWKSSKAKSAPAHLPSINIPAGGSGAAARRRQKKRLCHDKFKKGALPLGAAPLTPEYFWKKEGAGAAIWRGAGCKKFRTEFLAQGKDFSAEKSYGDA
jgi:hypothetical protein